LQRIFNPVSVCFWQGLKEGRQNLKVLLARTTKKYRQHEISHYHRIVVGLLDATKAVEASLTNWLHTEHSQVDDVTPAHPQKPVQCTHKSCTCADLLCSMLQLNSSKVPNCFFLKNYPRSWKLLDDGRRTSATIARELLASCLLFCFLNFFC
jgi:hypothetical protein